MGLHALIKAFPGTACIICVCVCVPHLTDHSLPLPPKPSFTNTWQSHTAPQLRSHDWSFQRQHKQMSSDMKSALFINNWNIRPCHRSISGGKTRANKKTDFLSHFLIYFFFFFLHLLLYCWTLILFVHKSKVNQDLCFYGSRQWWSGGSGWSSLVTSPVASSPD